MGATGNPRDAAGRAGPVLVIDDDRLARAIAAEVLVELGFEVVEAGDGGEGLEVYRSARPAWVLSDLHMPRMQGLEVLRRLRELDPQAVVVLMSGYPSLEVAVEAMKAGAADFVPKPVTPATLVAAVGRARRAPPPRADRGPR